MQYPRVGKGDLRARQPKVDGTSQRGVTTVGEGRGKNAINPLSYSATGRRVEQTKEHMQQSMLGIHKKGRSLIIRPHLQKKEVGS